MEPGMSAPTPIGREHRWPAGLKARMPGAMLEVVSPEPRRARDALAGQPGVRGVLLIGIGLHVHVDDPARRAGLAAALAAAEVPVSEIAEVAPSIEDLFVALLGDAEGPA